jgi:hypothetical protein
MIKRRNLDPSLVGWLMNTLGLGPGIGDVHHVAGADTAYYSWLRDDLKVDPAHIHYSVAAGEDALTASRNDVLLVHPDTYTVTASLTWDKHMTHLVGLGGPLSRGAMGNGCLMNCETTGVGQLIDVQGHNCQFHNINLRNDYASANNLSALKLSTGRNFFGKNLHLVGQCAATQVATAAACALWFYSSGSARPWGAKFQDCKIGDAGEIVRTAGGPIYFSGTTAYTLKDVEFENCRIVGWAETVTCPAVTFAANYCADRYILFKDTLFFNYWTNNEDSCNQVFSNSCGTTLYIVLMNSTAVGYDAWDDSGFDRTYGAMPVTAANCGIGTQIANA